MLFLTSVGASVGVAQVGFAWPDTAVDVSRYETIEECIAAVNRVADGQVKHQRVMTGVWFDTMPYDPLKEAAAEQVPSAVTATATRCMARFDDPATILGERHPEAFSNVDYLFKEVMDLYLLANRDEDMAAFVAAQVKAMPERSGQIHNMAIAAYRRARPVRVATLDSLYREQWADSTSPSQRFRLSMALWELATATGDTARANAYKVEIVSVWPQLQRSFREALLAPEYLKPNGQERFDIIEDFYRQSLLDTLRRHGTVRYAAARATFFKDLADVMPERIDRFSRLDEFHKLVGQPAPAIVGDFWYRRGDDSAPRPTRGKVGLVVFFDPTPPGNLGASSRDTDSAAVSSSCLPARNSREELEAGANLSLRADNRYEEPLCWEIAAVLRRLAERFPALEITVVTQTYGSFVYSAYPKEPKEEAEVIRRWLHDVHRVPGALAVTATSYTYLPDPDGRVRRYRSVPNGDNYFSGIRQTWTYRVPVFPPQLIIYTSVIPNGSTFLVDRDGIIASALQVNRKKEADLAEVIDILLQSKASSSGSGPSVRP